MKLDFERFDRIPPSQERFRRALEARGIHWPEFVGYCASLHSNSIVMAAGSLVDGTDNRYSDIDLFVLSNGSLPTGQIQISNLGETRIDVEFRTFAEFNALRARLAHSLNLSQRPDNIDFDDLKFFDRILRGLVVFSGAALPTHPADASLLELHLARVRSMKADTV
ncbi:nucleotidyltransferase domain-containing protein [Bradyrhizobium sp. SUTN9-2]|uniref:nucleotidyltransferase domain-containing protein n=1 Tax=Bradyrhizobium sp. SUTN9-2 TaxID=1167456 RepID=UPI0013048773|nr:nucleotidyltransferase domain-containing protein [Bradyrhizobium sp. SUTN9-2]